MLKRVADNDWHTRRQRSPRGTIAHMRYFALLVLFAGCAGVQKPASTVATQERDAPLKPTQGAIGGAIVDSADGTRLPMVMIQAEQDNAVVAMDISDHKGRYRLGPLAEGGYRVTARFADARVVYEGVMVHTGFETDVAVNIDLRNHADRVSTTFTEGERGTIKGTIVDAVDGQTFPGVVVTLSASHLSNTVMAIADEGGVFRFRSLRPGRYNLSCYYHLATQGSVEIRRGNIVVAPGETTAVQLQLDLDLGL